MSEKFSYAETESLTFVMDITTHGRLGVTVDSPCCGEHTVILPAEQIGVLIEWLQEHAPKWSADD